MVILKSFFFDQKSHFLGAQMDGGVDQGLTFDPKRAPASAKKGYFFAFFCVFFDQKSHFLPLFGLLGFPKKSLFWTFLDFLRKSQKSGLFFKTRSISVFFLKKRPLFATFGHFLATFFPKRGLFLSF